MTRPSDDPPPTFTPEEFEATGQPLRVTFEGVVASALFVALIAVILVQVGGRLGFFRGPVWTEELARWLWVWMAIIGLGAVERNNAHLRMGILVDALGRRARLAVYTLIDLVYLGITCHLIWIGYRSVMRTWNNVAVTLPVTDAVLYASYPVAAAFVVLRILQRIGLRATGREEAA